MRKQSGREPDEGEKQERQAQYSGGRFNYALSGVRRTPLSDLYFFLISSPWWWLLLAAFAGYILINLGFAALYRLDGNAVGGAVPLTFADAFFFSVQTFSTIGYGALTPNSFYGHTLVTLESFAGMVAVAMGTGIIFAKFSRPSARVAFSNVMVIHERNGIPTLQFRIANQRKNEIFAARLKVSVLMEEVTAEGQHMRRFHRVPLEREDAPLFTMTWTAFHRIDQTSPIYGVTAETCTANLALIIATFDGTDATFLQAVQARKLYQAGDIRFDHEFVDIIERSEGEQLVIHHENLHKVQPVTVAETEARVSDY